MTEITRIAERHNLFVIEDCAQAAGAVYCGRKVGTFGAAAFYSCVCARPMSSACCASCET